MSNDAMRRHVAAVCIGGLVAGCMAAAAQGATTSITVEPINWTDRSGSTTHAARSTNVEFWDDDTVIFELGALQYLGMAPTNAAGSVTFTTEEEDYGSDIEFFTYVRAAIPGIAHVKANLADAEPYRLRVPTTGTYDVSEGGSVTFAGVTVDNTLTDNIGTSIGFVQAVGFMGNYYNNTHGANLPFVTIVYNNTITGSAYYGGANPYIELRYGAWGAWDVLMHEYGHHVATEKGFDDSAGGNHAAGENNIGATQQGAAALPGAKLAWSEGVATHLALMANHHGNLAAYFPSLPGQDTNTQYDSYQSTASVTNETHLLFRYDVETKSTSFGRSDKGEGDEMSVGRVLWDFYDSGGSNENYATGQNRNDQVSFGATRIFDQMDDNNTVTFRDYWHVAAAQGVADPALLGLAAGAHKHLALATLGEVLEEYNVAGRPITAGTTNDTTPKLTFAEGNDDRSGSYAWVVFDTTWNLIRSALQVNDLEDLGTFSWDVDVALPVGSYYWAVLNTSALYDTFQPSLLTDIDKWYWSGVNTLTIIPEPSATAMLSLLLLARWRRSQRC